MSRCVWVCVLSFFFFTFVESIWGICLTKLNFCWLFLPTHGVQKKAYNFIVWLFHVYCLLWKKISFICVSFSCVVGFFLVLFGYYCCCYRLRRRRRRFFFCLPFSTLIVPFHWFFDFNFYFKNNNSNNLCALFAVECNKRHNIVYSNNNIVLGKSTTTEKDIEN